MSKPSNTTKLSKYEESLEESLHDDTELYSTAEMLSDLRGNTDVNNEVASVLVMYILESTKVIYKYAEDNNTDNIPRKIIAKLISSVVPEPLYTIVASMYIANPAKTVQWAEAQLVADGGEIVILPDNNKGSN